jgi:hypothetical protein
MSQEVVFVPIPLQAGWTAWHYYPDGGILLQFQKKVLNTQSGDIVDLEEGTSSQLEKENLLVRSLYLSPDGSVHCEPNAMSFEGVLSEGAFQILEKPEVLFARHMANPPFKK